MPSESDFKYRDRFQIQKREDAQVLTATLQSPGGRAVLKYLFEATQAGSPAEKTPYEQGMAAVYWWLRGVAGRTGEVIDE